MLVIGTVLHCTVLHIFNISCVDVSVRLQLIFMALMNDVVLCTNNTSLKDVVNLRVHLSDTIYVYRKTAIALMSDAIDQYVVRGLSNNLCFLSSIMRNRR